MIKLNEGEDKIPGTDDIMPIFSYIFIKAHPFRIFSDIEFIKLFTEKNTDRLICLNNMESTSNAIFNFGASYFNLNEEEYKKKFKEVVINEK